MRCAPLESIGKKEQPLGDIAARHRDVLAALSRDGDRELAFAGPDGTKLADALDELAASDAADGTPAFCRPIMSSCFPRRWLVAWCGRRRKPGRACASSGSSKRD